MITRKPDLEIHFVPRVRRRIATRDLARALGRLPTLLARYPGRVSGLRALRSPIYFIFVGTQAMTKLNFQYRGKKKATDVLTFPGDDFHEIYLCVDVVRTQARENRHPVSRELAYLALHGTLHAMGYDHEKNAREERRMFQLQDWLFARVTPNRETSSLRP